MKTEAPKLDFAPDDPILTCFQSSSGPVDVDKLQLDSPGLRALKESGVKMVVPLVSQGELIGLINLGPRRKRGRNKRLGQRRGLLSNSFTIRKSYKLSVVEIPIWESGQKQQIGGISVNMLVYQCKTRSIFSLWEHKTNQQMLNMYSKFMDSNQIKSFL